MEQVAETASPEFTGSLPKVKGTICGATKNPTFFFIYNFLVEEGFNGKGNLEY